MVRKTCFALFPFQAGLLAAFLLGSRALLLIPFVLGAAAVCFACFKAKRAYAAVICVFFCVGCAVSSIYTLAVYDDTVAFDGQSVSVKGYVYDKKDYDSGSCAVTVKGIINDSVDAAVTFYLPYEEYSRLSYGEEITVFGTVSRIRDSALYQSERYYKSLGVFVKGGNADRVVSSGRCSHRLLRFARELRDSSFLTLSSYGEGGRYLAAMLCGDRSYISSSAENELYRAGIGHIFAFSGTHITIITGALAAALELISKRRRVNTAVVLCFTWALVLFSGPAVSAVRAGVMMSVLLLTRLLKRPADPLTALAIAGGLITAASPYSVGSYSFLLSMEGAFAYSAYTDFLCERLHEDKFYQIVGIKRTAIATLCVGLLQLPVSALLFGEVSVIAPLTNFLLIPVCSVCLSLAVIGLVIGLVPAASGAVLGLSAVLMKGCVTLARLLSLIPFSSVNTSHTAVKCVCAFICVLPVILPLLARRRHILVKLYAAAAALLVAVSAVTYHLSRDKLHIIIFPTDYGEAALLYDTEGSLFISNGGAQSIRTAEQLTLDRAVPALYGAAYKGMAADSAFLDSSPYITGSGGQLQSPLGNAALESKKIICTNAFLDIVITDKKVYNNSNGYEIDLADGAVELTLDRRSGELTVRRL